MSSGFGATASASDTNITNRFDLDTGQRDNFYDIGRIKLKDGAYDTKRKTPGVYIDVDNGKVIESGTHDDLVLKDNMYKRLWDVQTGMQDKK